MKGTTTKLTTQERDVLVLSALHPDGKQLSNSEIGQRLNLPVTSVKALIHQACLKLEAHNRNQAVFFALRRGEIRIDEFYSLDELAECLSSLDPDMLIRIAQLIRQDLEHGPLRRKYKQIILTDKRLDAILLTNRERDVLMLVGRGLTNKEIADRLCVSTSAVRNYLNRACTKLGAGKRVDAFLLALKQREIGFSEIFSLNESLQVLAPLGAENIEKIAQLLSQKLGQEPGPTGS